MNRTEFHYAFEGLGLLSALGFLITLGADMFWPIPLFYLVILAACCLALSAGEEL